MIILNLYSIDYQWTNKKLLHLWAANTLLRLRQKLPIRFKLLTLTRLFKTLPTSSSTSKSLTSWTSTSSKLWTKMTQEQSKSLLSSNLQKIFWKEPSIPDSQIHPLLASMIKSSIFLTRLIMVSCKLKIKPFSWELWLKTKPNSLELPLNSNTMNAAWKTQDTQIRLKFEKWTIIINCNALLNFSIKCCDDKFIMLYILKLYKSVLFSKK